MKLLAIGLVLAGVASACTGSSDPDTAISTSSEALGSSSVPQSTSSDVLPERSTETEPSTTTTRAPSTTTSVASDTALAIEIDPSAPVRALRSFEATAVTSVLIGAAEGVGFSVEAAGTFSDGAYECTVSFTFGEIDIVERLLSTEGAFWLDTGQGYSPASFNDVDVTDIVDICPTTPGFWAEFGSLPIDSSGGTEQLDGVSVRRVEVGELLETLSSLGFDTGTGDVDEVDFVGWIADPGGWVAGVDISAPFTAEEIASFLGLPNEGTGEPGQVTYSLRVFSADDTSLTVNPPPPNYFDFRSIDGLTIVGVAEQSGAALRLTPSRSRLQAGAAWFTAKQPVAAGFETAFEFRISDIPQNPGDGFALVIQNTSPDALGAEASGIGYKGLRNSVAIEFDTTFQDYEADPIDSHVAVHTLGTEPNTSHRSAMIEGRSEPINIANGALHTVRIVYVPGTLDIYLDDLTQPILTVGLDLDDTLNLENGTAWIGFTAATEEGFRETHDILGWTFTPA